MFISAHPSTIDAQSTITAVAEASRYLSNGLSTVGGAGEAVRAIAFVDSAIADIDTLIQNIENAEVVVIDAESGIDVITQTLSEYEKSLESVHIFSHGSAGRLQIGRDELSGDVLQGSVDSQNVVQSISQSVSQWGNALREAGDLLLYGCNVAAGEVGRDFLSEMSRITGVDVGASIDITGRGGDWILEANAGSIEAAVVVSAEGQRAFADSLNILGSGGFEEGDRNSGPWRWWNAGEEEQIAAGQGISGSRAAVLASGQSGVGQVVDAQAGKTYRLTAHAKTTSQGFSTFGLKFLDGSGKELASVDIGQIRSRDWQVAQVARLAPQGTAKVQAFGFKWADDGETYLDNISLQVDGDRSVPAAPDSSPRPIIEQVNNLINADVDRVDADESVSVFLLGGQSNMVGLGRNQELPEALAQPNENVQIWQDSTRAFINLQPGFSNPFSGDGPEFGPELTFGRSIQGYNGKDVYLIKHATGSTSLINDWNPNGANNREYDIFVDRVDKALADLRGQGVNYSIDGMLWMQGEADSYSEASANAYQANLTAFIGDMRDRYGQGMKFVIGQLHNSFDTAYDDRVRNAQFSVAAADGNTSVASTNGFGLYGDQIHYNTAGQISLGYSFANAVKG